jgi:ribosomal-protein-alanine N-acetyltransferase
LFDYSTFPKIETDRLTYRQMTHDDAQGLFDMFSQEEAVTHLEIEAFKKIEEAIEMIDWYNDMFDDKGSWRWGIYLKSDDTFIGTAGFFMWEETHRKATIGYDFNPKYWNQGYATEVTNRMVQFGFEEMNLHRIEADTNEDNYGSIRVLEKSGFTLEGMWRENTWEKGRFVSLKQFGILESEYQK